MPFLFTKTSVRVIIFLVRYMDRIILHIDVNNAFLSWSAIDLLNKGAKYDIRNSYAVIGGDEKARRGIVLAKSMPAKKQGVVTAETLYSAKKKCPALRIYPPNFEFYSIMSHKMFEILYKYTPDIEIASIDECYMDYGKIKKINGNEVEFAHKIQKEIYDTLGFTVNVGVANNKLCAKMASDFSKPNKIHTLYSNEVEEKMYPLPIGDLFGVGKKTASILKELGIFTIGELANADPNLLKKKFKNQVDYLINSARGIDNSEVISYKTDPKCISTSTTLPVDAFKLSEVKDILKEQAEKVGLELRKEEKYAYVVAAIMKNKDFQNVSKQTKIKNPTNITKEIYEVALKLMEQIWDKNGVRLIGIRVSNLVSNRYFQGSLFDSNIENDEKMKNLEKTIDNIKEKYGIDKINENF